MRRRRRKLLRESSFENIIETGVDYSNIEHSKFELEQDVIRALRQSFLGYGLSPKEIRNNLNAYFDEIELYFIALKDGSFRVNVTVYGNGVGDDFELVEALRSIPLRLDGFRIVDEKTGRNSVGVLIEQR